MTNPTPPAICAVVAGPLQVWLDTGTANALQFLGWNSNGASIEEIPYNAPIHSDENGGEQGPPVDYQYFGMQHRLTFELTKFQPAVLALLAARYNPNTSSSSVGVGMLLGCSNANFRCLLWGPNFVRNYLAAIPLEPIDWSPVGAQATRIRVSLTCNAVNGVLYNSVFT